MADFKHIEGQEAHPVVLGGMEMPPIDEQAILTSRPAFETFDLQTQGGLMVAESGQVFEVRNPTWVVDGDYSLEGRSSALPVTAVEGEDGFEFTWHGEPFDKFEPSLGGEFEISTEEAGVPYEISLDGENVIWPDGSTEKLSDLGLDPEALRAMLEFKTEKAYGFRNYSASVIERTHEIEQILAEHGLNHSGLSLFSEALDFDSMSDIAIVRRILGGMIAREFGVMSSQLHVQIITPEAAEYALNRYQVVQALFGLITASAPIRDGSFETTIGDHYNTSNGYGPKPETSVHGPAYIDPYLDNHDYLTRYEHQSPYDWRELARVKGSPTGGAMEHPAPVEFKEFLRQGDQLLRDGTNVTMGRTLGWHSDRHRIDYGTSEVNNMGPAGGNLHKTLSAQEIVSNYFVALQLHYLSMSPSQRAEEAEMYEAYCETGHVNNIMMALNGNEPDFRFRQADGNSLAPRELLTDILQFTEQYLPDHTSDDSQREAFATLELQEFDFETVEELFQAFFQQYSPLTATDAYNMAHKLDPGKSVAELRHMFSVARRQHVFDVYAEHIAEQNGQVSGIGAMALI